jgi:hypothetical protein
MSEPGPLLEPGPILEAEPLPSPIQLTAPGLLVTLEEDLDQLDMPVQDDIPPLPQFADVSGRISTSQRLDLLDLLRSEGKFHFFVKRYQLNTS